MVAVYSNDRPEVLIEQRIRLLCAANTDDCFAVTFTHAADYLAEPAELPLVGLIAASLATDRAQVQGAIFFDTPALQEQLQSLSADPQSCAAFARQFSTPWLNFNHPLKLVPVTIPKPWGQEIWYTGIEARGQSLVTAQGFTTPLPWVLALLPGALMAGQGPNPILLKILDPLPDEVYGDLYFEMHEQKQEVYVVTHIDPHAWPSGTGAIRMGFAAEARAGYPNDAAFKQAYLEAVDAYNECRTRIDRQLDQKRLQAGIDICAPVAAHTLMAWQEECGAELLQVERDLRRRMDAFTAMFPLRVGDVVKVPCRVPHALQHGVRTVEFQTPVYERKILSFAQKVLTQQTWDTEIALANIVLEPPSPEPLTVIMEGDGVVLEQVVRFDDFEVRRLVLEKNCAWQYSAVGSYALLLVIKGELQLASEAGSPSTAIFAEQHAAFFLSAATNHYQLRAGASQTIVLLAVPR